MQEALDYSEFLEPRSLPFPAAGLPCSEPRVALRIIRHVTCGLVMDHVIWLNGDFRFSCQLETCNSLAPCIVPLRILKLMAYCMVSSWSMQLEPL